MACGLLNACWVAAAGSRAARARADSGTEVGGLQTAPFAGVLSDSSTFSFSASAMEVDPHRASAASSLAYGRLALMGPPSGTALFTSLRAGTEGVSTLLRRIYRPVLKKQSPGALRARGLPLSRGEEGGSGGDKISAAYVTRRA